MNSHITRAFRDLLDALPSEVQSLADKNFHLWMDNPTHPSIGFKKVRGTKTTWSARVGDHYRALADRTGDEVTWFWIGSHAEYDILIGSN